MPDLARPAGPTWPSLPTHRAWLGAECERLLTFAEASVRAEGGFSWLDAQGRPLPDRPVETLITCRMTHVFALAHLMGRPGSGVIADHGLAALRGLLHDDEHGGWFAAVGGEEAGGSDKRAYEHAFVVLACSSAAAAGRSGADSLLEEALAVVERRFWREDDGLCVDVWDRAWREPEPYRGANANMHSVEAFLAAADVTGDLRWRERALRMTEQLLHVRAREHGWRVPEHFDEHWRELPDYNRSTPAHPFRPYGATIGHGFEWARLALHVRAALGDPAPAWLLEAAQGLFATAVADGWDADGHPGFVYTTDWSGAPAVRSRLHWVVCEAIAAAAALSAVTGDEGYDAWYRTWWDHAARAFLDREDGSWHHELDPQGRPSATVWGGKPDAYHAVQATLLPRLPLAPSLPAALRAGLLDDATARGSAGPTGA